MVERLTEADTRRKYVVPKLNEPGWDSDPYSVVKQRAFTDGRIIIAEAQLVAEHVRISTKHR